MKSLTVLVFSLCLIPVVIFSGCTSSTPAPVPAVTQAPAMETSLPQPTFTLNPYPDALAPNMPVAFGTGTKTGEMAAYGYKVKPMFSWGDPSWNSPREQAESQGPFETQKGYNTRRPADGNTFVFVYLNVAATGAEAVWAPSPAMITLYTGGRMYSYTSVGSAKTTVEGESVPQYDLALGSGGTGGYVQPGKSNNVKGYLIYEVPLPFVPETAYVIANPDTKTQGVWKLV